MKVKFKHTLNYFKQFLNILLNFKLTIGRVVNSYKCDTDVTVLQ